MALLSHGLIPASFRGAPFAVEQDDTAGGRRIALHVYPGRDAPWAEDMGRAPRTFRFRGFIVDGDVLFAGGPIQLQRVLLLAALEKEGPGTLTHPTLGILNVVVRGFSMGADLGAGRMSRLDVEFVESGKRSFPSLLSSNSGLLSASNLAKVALAADLVRGAALVAGALGGNDDARATGSALAGETQLAAADATSLSRLAAHLPGNYGRYAAGGNAGYLAANGTTLTASTTSRDLAVAASSSRDLVSAAATGLALSIASVAAPADYESVAAAIVAVVDALLAACADPADAIRLLSNLISYRPTGRPSTSATGSLVLAAFRRAVAAALGAAVAEYQPSSYDDAFNVMSSAVSILDDQATVAADAGEDASYQALRALRAEVAQDLRSRGAQLARVRSWSVPTPSPALQLAQRFYRDPSRADQLLSQAAARHPLFMPTTITALAS